MSSADHALQAPLTYTTALQIHRKRSRASGSSVIHIIIIIRNNFVVTPYYHPLYGILIEFCIHVYGNARWYIYMIKYVYYIRNILYISCKTEAAAAIVPFSLIYVRNNIILLSICARAPPYTHKHTPTTMFSYK